MWVLEPRSTATTGAAGDEGPEDIGKTALVRQFPPPGGRAVRAMREQS